MLTPWPPSPHIYEINTRLWLRDLSRKYGRTVVLSSVPDEEIESLKKLGFDALWLMGVWTPSPKGREIARSIPGLLREYEHALPDLTEEDIGASPYAISDYLVSPALGGEKGLRAFRKQAQEHGLKLLLDFVPNHTALDHPWVTLHPDFYVRGTVEEREADRGSFFNAAAEDSPPLIVAHGRDPYFPGWTDTAQLNYFHRGLREHMITLLLHLASLCDGVRCDMAMLILRDIHCHIWGDRLFRNSPDGPDEEFWMEAIREVRAQYPSFLFVAEAYWMREGELQLLGFDYTYDKALYDWLRSCESVKINEYLRGPFFYQGKCLRFIENHDEPRARATFSEGHQRCAALLSATLPGGHLYHEGELEGYEVRTPVQLLRRRDEMIDQGLKEFYESLLPLATKDIFRKGKWTLLESYPAWDENYRYLHFVIYLWEYGEYLHLVVVNLSPSRSQCYVPLPARLFEGHICILNDLLESNYYERDGDMLSTRGLYLDMPPFYRHLFDVKLIPKQGS
jgi:hypothetical protein